MSSDLESTTSSLNSVANNLSDVSSSDSESTTSSLNSVANNSSVVSSSDSESTTSALNSVANNSSVVLSSDSESATSSLNSVADNSSVVSSSDSESTTSSLNSVVSNSSDVSHVSTIESQKENLNSTNKNTNSNDIGCNHSYSVTKNTADCTNNGYKIYTCSKCKATYKEKSLATGHKYKYTETAPTCTTGGFSVGVCQKCSVEIKEKTLSATGHSFKGATCSKCGIKDIDKARNMLYEWFKDNSSFDETAYGQTYSLPSDKNYSLWANEYKNCSFTLSSSDIFIDILVYGFEKNKCYVTFKQNGHILEGEFPMDSLHSSDRNFFNAMHCTASQDNREQMIATLRTEIDGFLLKFEKEVLKSKVNITLKDLGFSSY